jgi:DNA topoisomerase IA
MEELGIGRPSTYASDPPGAARPRLRPHGQEPLHPEDKGRLVTAFLEQFFNRYVEYDFTADLEQKLDAVSAGEPRVQGAAARLLARLPGRRRRDRRAPHHRRCWTR